MKKLIAIMVWLVVSASLCLAQWQAILSAGVSSSAPPNITADLWSPMETVAPDATTLKTASSPLPLGTVAGSSTWDTSHGTQLTSTSAQKALISTVNGNSTSGTYGYVGHHDTPNYVRIDLNTGYTSNQSVVFSYQCTALDSGSYTIPAAWGEDGSTPNVIVRFRVENNAGVYTAMLETDLGTSSAITIAAATSYYVTVKVAVSGGTCSLAVFNSAGTQVGSTVTIAGQSKNLYYHIFGCFASISASGDDYVDNYCIDKTSATFPLGP